MFVGASIPVEGVLIMALVVHMGASINRGPQNRPKYIMVLTIGTTKMGPLICGSSHMQCSKAATARGLGSLRRPNGPPHSS